MGIYRAIKSFRYTKFYVFFKFDRIFAHEAQKKRPGSPTHKNISWEHLKPVSRHPGGTEKPLEFYLSDGVRGSPLASRLIVKDSAILFCKKFCIRNFS